MAASPDYVDDDDAVEYVDAILARHGHMTPRAETRLTFGQLIDILSQESTQSLTLSIWPSAVTSVGASSS